MNEMDEVQQRDYDHRLLQTFLKGGLDVDLTPRACKLCSLVTLLANVEPGDHIAIRSVYRGRTDVIWHHGIFMGGVHVVHMHPDGNISKVTLDQFVAAPSSDTYVESAAVLQYEGDSDAAHARTLYMANFALHDEKFQALVYDVLTRQCDGFAAWCRTGRYVEVGRLMLDAPYNMRKRSHPKM